MTKDTYRLAISVLILAVSMATLAQDSHPHSAKVPQDSAGFAFSETMKQMHGAMASVEPSGVVDVDFVNLMLPHHRAAVEMAKTQLTYGTDPQMRRLAQEIITDQQSEIELMQLWLKQHGHNSKVK